MTKQQAINQAIRHTKIDGFTRFVVWDLLYDDFEWTVYVDFNLPDYVRDNQIAFCTDEL